MTIHKITFKYSEEDQEPKSVNFPTGTLLSEAANQAGCEIRQPCGGQGRCGR
jgi:ferredoxin